MIFHFCCNFVGPDKKMLLVGFDGAPKMSLAEFGWLGKGAEAPVCGRTRRSGDVAVADMCSCFFVRIRGGTAEGVRGFLQDGVRGGWPWSARCHLPG